MRYAKVVVGLPVEGPFDYLVPAPLEARVRPGCRVWVNFRNKKALGYVVALAARTLIPRVKPLLECIDAQPVLDADFLLLAREISRFYCCSWAEAIETALPGPLRAGKAVNGFVSIDQQKTEAADLAESRVVLIQDPDGDQRWQEYVRAIKAALEKQQSVILILPDIASVNQRSRWLAQEQGLNAQVLYRQQQQEFRHWCELRAGRAMLVVGTRSALFAPLADLGLIIVDEERDPAYKQDQVPHYHAREAAVMRARLERCSLIMGGYPLSLEALALVRSSEGRLVRFDRARAYPATTIVDMKNLPLLDRKKKMILSRMVQDKVSQSLAASEKVLIFLNRKGFATQAACSTCGRSLECPRCSINLVYFYAQNKLACHYCNFSMDPPKVCPQCNSGYIKYSGAGTEKIESEIARIFPAAKIALVQEGSPMEFNAPGIYIASQQVLRAGSASFDTVVCLGIDHALNHVDFRAAEKVFALLSGLVRLTASQFIVQTNIGHHYCFSAIARDDPDFFYREELKFRRQLRLPPAGHIAAVKLRGPVESRVAEAAKRLYAQLQGQAPRSVAVSSVNPGLIARLRGKFYWTILASAPSAVALSQFLKNSLKDFRQTGIIVTVDIDPL